jgi:cardiolipin synthase
VRCRSSGQNIIASLGLIPNLITCSRLLAAPLLVYLILIDRFDWALLLTIPIGISDWLDGALARRLNSVSRLGLYLDPAADKILLVVSFISLGVEGSIPPSIVWLVVARDAVIVTGAALLWRFRHRTKFSPVLVGKFSTAFQIATVVAVLLNRVFPSPLMSLARTGCFLLTVLFTLVSGAVYIRKGIQLTRWDSTTPGPARPPHRS